MGLFSFLSKNKQEAAEHDSGHYAPDDDDAVAARARSKRASSAGEPAGKRGKEARAADPLLLEKKRARRRLVGALALAMAVAIGLPMILDSEKNPVVSNIDLRIPSKEKTPAQPLPAAVAAADALDKREVIVAPPALATPATPAAPQPSTLPPLVTLPRDVAEVKLGAARTEAKTEAKTDARPDPKPALKVVAKPPEAKPADPKLDAARALAILEGKPLPAPAAQKYTMQVAALASQDKVNELMARLKEAGIPASAQKGPSAAGEVIRVKVGPFSKDEGEKIRPKLEKLGLTGKAVAN